VITKPEDAKLLLVDGHNFLHRVLHLENFVSLHNADNVPTGGVYGFMSTLRNSFKQFYSVGRVVVVWDGGRSERRKTIYPEYKANRVAVAGKEEAWQAHQRLFSDQLLRLVEVLTYLGVHQVRLAGREGDDIIGYIARLYPEDKAILSEDQDLYQLVNDNTAVYRPVREEFMCASNFEAHVGVPQPLFVLKKSMEGDTSDNISSIPKVGSITVDKIVKNVTKHLALDSSVGELRDVESAVRATCSQLIVEDKRNASRYKAVLENFPKMQLNWDLVDLAKEEFTDAEKDAIVQEVEAGVCFHEPAVLEQLQKYEINSFLKSWSWFSSPFRCLR
jgi:DNA polymerase-1